MSRQPKSARVAASAASIALLMTTAAYASAPTEVIHIKLEDPSTGPSVTKMQIVLDRDVVK
ncbi:MAG TPA: hypothetical protein VKT00_03330, partial [Casimicrobiaceae bacterium]|nr:hypothetical protein [Casimicrobiaceae bacterium]